MDAMKLQSKKDQGHSPVARLPASNGTVFEPPGAQDALAKGNEVMAVNAVEPAADVTSLLGGTALQMA